jgi:hypothetical protein
MIIWLFRLTAACLLSFGMSELCAAQTRTMNSNSPGFLRSWPAIGSWQVILVHTLDNRFACVTVTGKKSDSRLLYLFGIENDTKNLYVLLADQNPVAMSANSVKVLIDNTIVGTYSIDKRKSTDAMSSIRALVPAAEVAKLLNLLKVGETVQFETDEATYSASLNGMTDAMNDIQSCLIEAQALETSN